jgi:hypothetical protein
MMNGSICGRGRVLATLTVGVALLAAGCGRVGGSPSAGGSSDYQKDLAFAHCMRAHGVPDFPDPLPDGGFPRTGGGNSLQSGSAMNACQHLLPAVQPLSAAQQAHVLAQDLKWSRCMRAHGFPGFSDPSWRPHGGVVITAPAGFDPGSPQAQAAGKTCKSLEGPVVITPGGGS